MTVIYNMSVDRADKPWIGDRRLTEATTSAGIRHFSRSSAISFITIPIMMSSDFTDLGSGNLGR